MSSYYFVDSQGHPELEPTGRPPKPILEMKWSWHILNM